MRIGVFLADERMKIVSEQLQKIADVTEISENDSSGKLRMLAPHLDVVVLPVWPIDDSGFVRLKTRGLFIAEFLDTLSSKCLVFTGSASKSIQNYQFKIIEYMKDAKLLKKNAEYTAEGLLAAFIASTPRSIFTYNIDIIGSGRCGLAFAQLCQKLNVPYRIVTTSHKPVDTPYDWISIEQWQKSDPYEIIVNTAPCCMMTQQTLKFWKSPKIVYDLSSCFVGIDQRCLKHPYLTLYQEKALPARYCEESAANLIVDVIKKELSE